MQCQVPAYIGTSLSSKGEAMHGGRLIGFIIVLPAPCFTFNFLHYKYRSLWWAHEGGYLYTGGNTGAPVIAPFISRLIGAASLHEKLLKWKGLAQREFLSVVPRGLHSFQHMLINARMYEFPLTRLQCHLPHNFSLPLTFCVFIAGSRRNSQYKICSRLECCQCYGINLLDLPQEKTALLMCPLKPTRTSLIRRNTICTF